MTYHRRAFPPRLAPDLVSVQPISQPSGMVFLTDYVMSQNSPIPYDGDYMRFHNTFRQKKQLELFDESK